MKKFCFVARLSLALLFCFFTSVSAEAFSDNSDSIKLYKEKEEVAQVFSYEDKKIYITDEELYLMAQVVYAESRAEPYNGKVAVASVILNRLLHPEFPKTIEGVVKQKGAFSCVINGQLKVIPDESSYKAVLDALKGNDPTEKAVFFYNPKIATSKWMHNVSKHNVKPIGNHVFFVIKR
jgi:N-acetylmuramoyl-L-alanine amidase